MEVEDAYPQLEVKDVYDTIQNSPKAAVIASRPPAPTPRPENMHASEEEDRTPYITKGIACESSVESMLLRFLQNHRMGWSWSKTH